MLLVFIVSFIPHIEGAGKNAGIINTLYLTPIIFYWLYMSFLCFKQAGLCCINDLSDSSRESSMIAERYEQLVPYEVQDQELALLQHSAEAARFSIDLV